ncbi:1707_t:CDS:1 [Gigaspora rosea]|nr:1707_t:CDS:1 [Gigaspora rosea]
MPCTDPIGSGRLCIGKRQRLVIVSFWECELCSNHSCAVDPIGGGRLAFPEEFKQK